MSNITGILKNKKNKLKIKGITIHATNNRLNAKDNYQLMLDNINRVQVHFFVDEKETINSWSLENISYHSGKGYDFSNLETISIEMCQSQCSDKIFKKVEKNTYKLINQLMKKYNLSVEDIYWHNDFDNVACPKRLIDKYNTKKEWLKNAIIR